MGMILMMVRLRKSYVSGVDLLVLIVFSAYMNPLMINDATVSPGCILAEINMTYLLSSYT